MEWSVDFTPAIDKAQVRLIRDTLEAKLKAEHGDFGDAARILWELLIELRHSGEKHWECITMVHMGKVYRSLRWAIAQKLLEDALKLAESLDFTLAKMMALTELGEMHCHWGKFKRSLELFSEALSQPESKLPEHRRLVLLEMAIAYEGLDDLKACRMLVEEAVEIDRLIGHPDIEEDLEHLERLKETD